MHAFAEVEAVPGVSAGARSRVGCRCCAATARASPSTPRASAQRICRKITGGTAMGQGPMVASQGSRYGSQWSRAAPSGDQDLAGPGGQVDNEEVA